ncbi:MAG: EAL domain-containing protein [Sulfuricella sp.]|jgi:GGDEF domain-containing protein/EAL domain-containing protein (putative c-di-GMP-specific phosphodiesterase class I)
MNLARLSKEKVAENIKLCRGELEQAIASRNFSTRFRQVASLKSCQVFGYFARVYGPPDSPMRDMAHYFAVAREMGLVDKLSSRYFESVLSSFKNNVITGELLLPLPEICLGDFSDEIAHLLVKALKKHEVPAQRVILVYPHSSPFLRPIGHSASKNLMKELRHLGFGLAAQGIGCTLDESVFLADWQPSVLLLDEQHFEDMDFQAASIERLRTLIEIETRRGRQVLAQGITTSSQLHKIRGLGIELASGDFIGKFTSKPCDKLSAAACQAISKSCGSISKPQEFIPLLERLLIKRSPVSTETPAEEVFKLFEAEASLRAIAVVKNGLPVGLISRYDMIDNMARPFRHELFGRRPCDRFMDPDPLVMDVGINLAELTDMVIRADPRHLVSGFIITRCGSYLGMGSVQDLMREVSAMQMEAAKYANPLTQLPGNVPINRKIDKLLGERAEFFVAYCDLDHFKPLNDVYGYAKGDEIILLTARLLSEAVEPETDFIGHIGGDDFVLIFRSKDWKARCEKALKRYEKEIQAFFPPGDIEQGGYTATNRKGEMEFFGLTSLSIGAVKIEPGAYASYLDVATVAAEVKKKAKAIAGNSFYVNQRRILPHSYTEAGTSDS